ARPAAARGGALDRLRTRAEATGYEETSRYADVVAFLEAVDRASDRAHLTHFGYSSEGRALPLLVLGDVADASPEAVRAAGKLRVYLQGDIHAGEVCGKEALLALARDLARGEHPEWTRSAVILFAPIYNPDGNERLDVAGRAGQLGPYGGVGQRLNARGFDLNRDHVKLDTPEARGLARLYREYDPHVAVDFHTTDGTYVAYYLTYSPPLHPNTDAGLVDLLRGDLLPTVTGRIAAARGWHCYYYGNLPPPYAGNLNWGDELGEDFGWYTFDYRPRYSNNYAGLRNRFGILSEAYAYATFEERILVSRYFAEEILQFCSDHAARMQAVAAAADAAPLAGTELSLRATHVRSPEKVTILMGQVAPEPNPYTGGRFLRRQDVAVPVEVYEYGTFAPTETARAPQAYCLPDSLAAAIDLLQAHGVRYRVLAADSVVVAERFRIDSTRVAEAPYEGHRERTLFGACETAHVTLAAGSLLVPVDQPLGRLAFALLEPRSDDGVTAWGLIDRSLDGALYYPILRLPQGP
ncbi:MAG: M14 family zinc carboxypeptidase, partial [Gemmatimonadota bacterium]